MSLQARASCSLTALEEPGDPRQGRHRVVPPHVAQARENRAENAEPGVHQRQAPQYNVVRYVGLLATGAAPSCPASLDAALGALR